jgi:hypothetical protein
MEERIPVVDIGVACAPHQTPDWWSAVMGLILYTERSGEISIGKIRTVSSALPDHNKNNTIGAVKRRWSLTDANRNEVSKGFIGEDADWIFWIDDDTVPPIDAILHLVKLGRPFVAGLYFLPRKPFNPIAYKRHTDSGLYYPIYNYPKGALMEVDSVGMGCTLIHRSVYEQIRDSHRLFERKNGALVPIHNDRVKNPVFSKHQNPKQPYIRAGVYHEQMLPKQEDDDRNFPFYLLEHGRTEDHFFCELAESVGIKPYIDTTVVCQHWKMQSTDDTQYDQEIDEAEGIFS